MKRMLVLLTAILLLLSSCSSATLDGTGKELEDVLTNISDADNKYVLMVKGGYRTDDPSVTYEDAFSAFFGTPRWKYFKSEDGQDVVEFTGDCIYRDVSVKARIQFVVDVENGTFQATYLAFNEIPQDALTLAAVISKAFEEVTASGTESSENADVITDDYDDSLQDELPESESPQDETPKTEPPQEDHPSTATKSDAIFETDYYTLTIPASWDGRYTYEQDGSNLTFYELESYNNGWGGKLFGISLWEDEEFLDFPGYYYMGALVELSDDGSAPGFLYYVAVSTPTDVQFSDDAAETYIEMSNSIDSILASLSTKSGYTIMTD